MPIFITFYPAVMLVAALAGLRSGLLATALCVLGTDYLILPPVGHLTIARTSDIVALAIFAAMGVFTSLLAEGYRQSQRSMAAAYKAEQESRHSEYKLQQASEYRQLALDAAGLGACEFRLESRDVAENKRCREIFGFQECDRIDYEAVLERIHPEDRVMVDDAIKQAIAGADGGLFHQEHRIVWPDGSIHWLASHGRAFFSGEGENHQAARLIAVTMDITARKRTEEHIRKLNRVYAVLSDINQTIVRVKDSQAMLEAACRIAVDKGKFRMAWIGMIDPATQVLKPIASGGMVDGYLDQLRIDFLDLKTATGPSARCFYTGKYAICNDIEHDPLYLPWRDEALRRGYRSSAGFPLTADGQTIGVFSLYASHPAFFDDEETKVLDEMAMDISFALEVNRREEERRQLEEQFRQAQKMEVVGQLTGGIAHDFNNLLTVIMGCSEVIGVEVKKNPHLSKMADMIWGAAKQGAELTHRMLAFARRQTLQPRSVNVYQLLVGMQSFLRRTLSEEIDVNVIQCGEDCDALVDPAQLESALLNLCLNARDAMPGGGKLTIETDNTLLDSDYSDRNPEVTPGQYILIAVSDTGTGISPQIIDRVFEPFFTTKEVGKGTGLGLSMVYGFAKQSRGHVKIYSEPGHGTSVKLYLPKANQKSEQSNQNSMSIADIRGSEVVLLVEDNAPVREFAKSQLVNLGYRVIETANGKDALKVIGERADIDLLFTDIVMPGGLNGRELGLEACRLNPKLKVLYCSGYAENAILHEGLLDKDVQFLSKPYTRGELARKIRGVLAGI